MCFVCIVHSIKQPVCKVDLIYASILLEPVNLERLTAESNMDSKYWIKDEEVIEVEKG